MVGVKKFDRRSEQNKKFKNKVQSNAFSRNAGSNIGQGQGKAKLYGNTIALAGSIPQARTGDNDVWIQNFDHNPHLEQIYEYLAEKYPEDYNDLKTFQNLAQLKYREVLSEVCGEYQRKGDFVRIYPAKNSKQYDKYFSKSFINKIVYKSLFSSEIMSYIKQKEFRIVPEKKLQDSKSLQTLNLKSPVTVKTPMSRKSLVEVPSSTKGFNRAQNEHQILRKANTKNLESSNKLESILQPSAQIVVTGDDILIEYVGRIATKLKTVSEMSLLSKTQYKITQFINHKIWHLSDINQPSLYDKLINRLNEMIDRRRRLIKYIYKKEENLKFESEYPIQIEQKSEIVSKFNTIQLEELLYNSSKNVAQEVVMLLISVKNDGVLSQIENL